MNEEMMPTQDERLMAALCHGAVLLPMWGLIASALIWVTQREASAYVRRQGMQAIAWQVLLLVVFFVGMGCYTVSIFGTIALTAALDQFSGPPVFMVLPFGTIGVIFLVMFLFFIGGIWAAVRSLQGRPFQYLLIGPRVDAFLQR